MDQFVEYRAKEIFVARARETIMNPTLLIQSQLLATKFFLPSSPGTLIPRPRLHALLDKALEYPFTLVSAPAGFGKTTLLSTWAQSLPASQARLCWLSLDEEDNDPYLFWTCVLSALQTQDPEHFAPLLAQLQSPSPPPLKSLLIQLLNLLTESEHHLVLILDDYHLITEEQVHTTLVSLVEHLPTHLHLILVTRADPPWPLSVLRAQRWVWEIRTEQLRCTSEETRAFFQYVVCRQLPDQILQEVTARTEGWLVGLHLLGLSLPEHVDPLTLLEQVSGEQRYILDYLTEVVVHKQTAEVRRFLLCTCILERFNASLCDAVMEQTGSQEMLKRLERANLFVVSLDTKREWYRYHALFAQALHSQLERSSADLVPILHARTSRWYAQHNQTTLAMLHAFEAREWHWAADLMEGAYHSLVSFTWGANSYALMQFRQWIEQLPAEVLASRPPFCLACVHLLWLITPHALLYRWLDLAEMALRTMLKEQQSAQASQGDLSSQGLREQRNLLGQVLTLRTLLQSFTEEGSATLALGEQALSLLSPENIPFRVIIARAQSIAYYSSSANDVMAAIKSGYQAAQLSQEARGQPAVTLCMMTAIVFCLIGAGRLQEAEQLTQRALQLQGLSDNPCLSEEGWIMFCQAEILRERNQLAVARSLVTEAISLCEQSILLVSLPFLCRGYTILIRVCLSCGDLDGAGTFLQRIEQIGKSLNQLVYLYHYSCFTAVDQVRLWLACGDLDRATYWANQLDVMQPHLTSFARERQEVAWARILLAQDQPIAALQRLEPALQRATAGQRWGHVLEIRLLQALAHQRLGEEPQALAALSEAVRLGEPEGYIRSFVEEGEAMQALLYRLRRRCAKQGPTPYLDTLLTAFQQESKAHHLAEEVTKAQPLPEPLSKRELEVLQLLAQGASNHEIAEQLVIAYETVKRHVGHIFSKLGVSNRVQAVRQARDLGLLDEQS
jgi:LuxR family maltose regulon positive regulatory protein